MKKITLKPEININAILVIDKKENQVFKSEHLNMTLEEYVSRAIFNESLNDAPKMPNVYNYNLQFTMSSKGITTKGYEYTTSAYQYEDNDKLIFVNVIDSVGEKIK